MVAFVMAELLAETGERWEGGEAARLGCFGVQEPLSAMLSFNSPRQGVVPINLINFLTKQGLSTPGKRKAEREIDDAIDRALIFRGTVTRFGILS